MSTNDLVKSPKNAYLGIDIATHIAFAVLGAMAVYFYQERLFGDTAFFLAKVIHNEALQIEHGRWISAFHEWIPLLAVKLGASIKTILVLYSLGHILFFYGLYLITRYVYHNITAGYLLVGIQVIGIDYGYYSPGFELYYATGFLVWFAVALEHGQKNKWQQLLLGLLTILIISSHITTLPIIGLVLLWHWSRHGWTNLRTYLILAACIMAVFIYKQLFPTSYELARMEYVKDNLYSLKFLSASYLSELWKVFWQQYFALLVVLVATVLYLLWKRLWMVLLVFLVAVFVMQYMNLLACPILGHTRYQEQCYYPLVFVVIFLMGMDILPKLEGNKFWIGSLFWAFIIIYRIVSIYNTGATFVDRTDIMRRLITHCQSLEGNKFKVKETNIDYLGLGTNWSYPIETMLLSKINPKNKTVTICYNSNFLTGSKRLIVAEDEYIFRIGEVYPNTAVNSAYFELAKGNYLPLNGSLAAVPKGKETANITILKQQIVLEVLNWPKEGKVNEQLHIPIKLTNKGEEPLNSDRIYLGYQWNSNDSIVQTKRIRTPIEFDVKTTHQQYLRVDFPQNKGVYTLQIAVIVADRYWEWLNMKQQQTITIN